jgi:hypothetical protein
LSSRSWVALSGKGFTSAEETWPHVPPGPYWMMNPHAERWKWNRVVRLGLSYAEIVAYASVAWSLRKQTHLSWSYRVSRNGSWRLDKNYRLNKPFGTLPLEVVL